MAVGPGAPKTDVMGLQTQATAAITVSGDVLMSTVFNAGMCRRLWVGSQGDLYLKRSADASFVKYTAVPANSYFYGEIVAIGGSTTAGNLVAEV